MSIARPKAIAFGSSPYAAGQGTYAFLFERRCMMKMKSTVLIKELNGDSLTPILILQKISGKKKFLLESSQKYNPNGRYSFIGADPSFELISSGDVNTIVSKTGRKEIKENPLETLKKLFPSPILEENPYPFIGGAVGYIGYDIVRQFETIGEEYPNSLNMPDVHLMFYEVIIAFDHLEDKVYVIGVPLSEESDEETVKQMMDLRIEELKQPIHYLEEEAFSFSEFQSEMTKEEFVEKVAIAKEYILSGDIFQVVLSQRMKSKFKGSPVSIYRKHHAQNPTPYMFYIDFDDYTVIGSSPESLIKTRGKQVIANPIAGTKRRGKNSTEDQIIAQELLKDEKELAEHKMLVDLGRNDLGKVCEFGSVHVKRYMEIEKYRHVMHIVSEVSGILRQDQSPLDAIAASLPAGTVSGAPKVRAMEIINQLEKSKRGLYSGAIGYLSVNGNMDFALAIRTMILKEDTAYIQAGAGIVYDSNPESEYEETLNKLKSFLEGGHHNDFTHR
jgi:anthranilate synthase component I